MLWELKSYNSSLLPQQNATGGELCVCLGRALHVRRSGCKDSRSLALGSGQCLLTVRQLGLTEVLSSCPFNQLEMGQICYCSRVSSMPREKEREMRTVRVLLRVREKNGSRPPHTPQNEKSRRVRRNAVIVAFSVLQATAASDCCMSSLDCMVV